MEVQTKPKTLVGDLKIMGIVLALIAFLNVIDFLIPFSAIAYMTSVLSSTSIVLFIAAASHLMRRIFFPNISITELVKSASDHPTGAGMVFLGISFILSALIVVNAVLLN